MPLPTVEAQAGIERDLAEKHGLHTSIFLDIQQTGLGRLDLAKRAGLVDVGGAMPTMRQLEQIETVEPTEIDTELYAPIKKADAAYAKALLEEIKKSRPGNAAEVFNKGMRKFRYDLQRNYEFAALMLGLFLHGFDYNQILKLEDFGSAKESLKALGLSDEEIREEQEKEFARVRDMMRLITPLGRLATLDPEAVKKGTLDEKIDSVLQTPETDLVNIFGHAAPTLRRLLVSIKHNPDFTAEYNQRMQNKSPEDADTVFEETAQDFLTKGNVWRQKEVGDALREYYEKTTPEFRERREEAIASLEREAAELRKEKAKTARKIAGLKIRKTFQEFAEKIFPSKTAKSVQTLTKIREAEGNRTRLKQEISEAEQEIQKAKRTYADQLEARAEIFLRALRGYWKATGKT